MRKYAISAVAILFFLSVTVLGAGAQISSLTVQGQVLDNDKPAPDMKVVLKNDDNGRSYQAKSDKDGRFQIVGVAQGDNYTLSVLSPSGELAWEKKKMPMSTASTGGELKIEISRTVAPQGGPTSAGGAAAANTSAGAGGGGKNAPAYTRDQIEAMKAKNEQAKAQNALITQALNAMNAKQWDQAVAPLEQLIAGDPNRYEFYQALGDSQFNLGQFDKAAATYEKGIQAAQNTAVDPKNPATDPVKKKTNIAKMYTNLGNADLKLKKSKEAVEAFTHAAESDPNPATAYFNLCATQWNTGNNDGALVACDKAIAADPKRADAYFIKGSLLFAQSTTDKSGKVTSPPGTAEAFNKYLELDPNGAHAGDVKQMLTFIGAKVETTYQEKKKK